MIQISDWYLAFTANGTTNIFDNPLNPMNNAFNGTNTETNAKSIQYGFRCLFY